MKPTTYNLQPTTYHRGFIALISTIIIAAVLLVLMVSTATTTFKSRFAVLDAELKEVSRGLAEACVETAILKYAQDDTYPMSGTFPDTVPVGSRECVIKEVDTNGVIKAQGEINNIYTNLLVDFDTNDFSIESWEEVSSF